MTGIPTLYAGRVIVPDKAPSRAIHGAGLRVLGTPSAKLIGTRDCMLLKQRQDDAVGRWGRTPHPTGVKASSSSSSE